MNTNNTNTLICILINTMMFRINDQTKIESTLYCDNHQPNKYIQTTRINKQVHIHF